MPPPAARHRPEGGPSRWELDSAGVREALGLPASHGTEERRYTEVSTDTRTLGPGALFVALKGERHDGADHLEEAAEAGAGGAVVPEGREVPGLGLEYFLVGDTLRALGALAAWRRRRCSARVVGITGSSGKTTVKEMVAAAVGGARRVYATPGNLNSLVGLPLTILQAPEEAEVWVLELGSSEPGEIEALAEIAEPDDAVVTTVGPAHLEFFGSVDGVMREKLSLVRGARRSGSVVVGERPPELGGEARRLRSDAVVAGIGDTADFRPERHGLEPERVWFERRGQRYRVEAGGVHHLRDALIAAAVAEALEVPAEAVANGLAGFRPLGMRSHLRRFGDLTVLVDCYNANPESFDAAIEYLSESFPGRRLAAVVGTMLEMGEEGPAAHRRVARRLMEAGFSPIAATGDFAAAAAKLREAGEADPDRFLTAGDVEAVWPQLAAALRGDEVVLVKASRGVRLERIVDRLERTFAPRQTPASASGEAGAEGESGASRSERPGTTSGHSASGGAGAEGGAGAGAATYPPPKPPVADGGAAGAEGASGASRSERPAPPGDATERSDAPDPPSPEDAS